MIQIKPLLLSGNHASGRGGHRPEALVIHVMEGTMESTLSWFRSPASKVSAHYGVSRAGEVVQYVRDEDTAWHAGRVLRPTAEMVLERPGVNPNLWTIGIEHEGGADQEPTSAQLAASAELMAMLADRWQIPLDLRHVIPHRAIYAAKTCPGRIDVGALVEMARRHGGAASPAAPEVAEAVIPPYTPKVVPGLAGVPRPPLVSTPPNLTPVAVPVAPAPRDWSEPAPRPSLWARITHPIRSLDPMRAIISRVAAAIVAVLLTFFAGTLGVEVSPAVHDSLVEGVTMLGLGLWGVLYALLHRLIDRKINPADVAKHPASAVQAPG